tara:strand:+ start:1470 stop:2972 length:1503 start_codon:yes stop_codon:yes gene_type:complete
MKNLILFFGIIFSLSKGYGQVTFNKTYEFSSGWDLGIASLIEEDSSIYSLIQSPITGGAKVYLAYLDPLGDTLWSKNILNFDNYPKTLGGNNGSETLNRYNDSLLLISGIKTLDTINFSSDSSVAFLYMISNTGDSIWYKEYGIGDSTYTKIRGSIINDDGTIISVGTSNSANWPGFESYLLKSDSVGNILWEKHITNSNSQGTDIVKQTPDGGYILSGGVLTSISEWDQIVIKVNALGNVVWRKEFGTVGESEYRTYVNVLTDTNYIIAGVMVNPLNSKELAFLAKLDLNGDTIWTQTYEKPAACFFTGVPIELNDGSLLLSGIVADTGTSITQSVWIVKVDSIGNMLWDRSFNINGGQNLNKIFDLDTCSNGGILLTGAVTSFPPTEWYAWLAKLDSNGCEQTGCANYLSVIENEADEEPIEFTIYPNPSTGMVNIELENDNIGNSLSIYNIVGEQILSEQIVDDEIKKDLSHLPKGIYIILVTDKFGQFDYKKLVLE